MTANYSDLDGVTKTTFKVAKATVNAANVATAQTFTLPATGGTFALAADIAATRFIDGGSASSTYTPSQLLDGGGA